MQLLIADGLVLRRDLVQGPGRPQHVFELSPTGSLLFPRGYQILADLLLEEIAGWDEALREQIFRRIVLRRCRRISGSSLPSLGFSERAEALAATFGEEGYMAEVDLTAPAEARLTFANCPLVELTGRYAVLCETELRAIGMAFEGMTVQVAEQRRRGDLRCVFRISANDSPAGP